MASAHVEDRWYAVVDGKRRKYSVAPRFVPRLRRQAAMEHVGADCRKEYCDYRRLVPRELGISSPDGLPVRSYASRGGGDL